MPARPTVTDGGSVRYKGLTINPAGPERWWVSWGNVPVGPRKGFPSVNAAKRWINARD